MSRVFFALPLLIAATTVACSPDTTDLFLAGGTAAGGASGVSGSTSSASKSATSTSTSPPDTTGSTNVSTSGDPDTVASSTSGPPPDTVSASASSGSPGGPTVDCGGAGACSTEDDGVCCFNESSDESACASADGCSLTGTGALVTAISCQLPSDCPGEICCARRYFNSGQQPYESTECSDSCGAPDVHLCDKSGPNTCPMFNDNGQPKQMFCKASGILPVGYFICSTMP